MALLRAVFGRAAALIPVGLLGCIVVASIWRTALFPVDSKSATPSPRRPPLEIRPDPLSLGVVGGGHRSEATFAIQNCGSELVSIERIETSCPCLSVSPEAVDIGPGEKVGMTIQFSTADEPDFAGVLSIEITGFAPEGVAFHTFASATVRKAGSQKSP
jgi:hypothetical protein